MKLEHAKMNEVAQLVCLPQGHHIVRVEEDDRCMKCGAKLSEIRGEDDTPDASSVRES